MNNKKVSKASITDKLDEIDRKLKIDLEETARGPLNDALKVLAPVFFDQNKVMREILDLCDRESFERVLIEKPTTE